MTKKEKIKTYLHDLLFCTFNTKSLFKFAIYSWITPLVVFILVCAAISLPPVISYNRLTSESVTSNVLYLDKIMAHVLSTDVKCHVEDKRFLCDEGYSYEEIYEFKNSNNDTIKYKIVINKSISDMKFDLGEYGTHYDSDNYLVFFETTFAFRYALHDIKTEKVKATTLYAFYDNMEGWNLSDIYTQSLTQENPESYLLAKSNEMILGGYKALLKEQIYTSLVADIGMYVVLILIIGLLIKGNLMFKRKKGFKYSQSLKIGLVASLQSMIIAFVLSLFGMNFMALFGLILVARIIYIYIRYTGSRKHLEWLNDLYVLTNDDRFKVEWR